MRSTTTEPPIPLALRLPRLEDVDAGVLAAGLVLDRARIVDAVTEGADLGELALSECSIEGWRATGALLRGAHVVETRITRLDAAELDASRSQWRDVELQGSRLGSADLSDADLRSIAIADCRIGHLNLRASRIRDLVVRDCTIDTVDVGDADLTRVRFEGTTVGALEVPRARMRHVDLRGLAPRSISPVEGLAGATIDADQLAWLAPLLATHVGIRVEG